MQGIDTSFIPSSNISFNDIGIYTERAIKDDCNIFFMEFLLCEKDRFDEIILREDNDESNNGPKLLEKKMTRFEKLKETVKKWIKGIWEKIKGFFATIIKKIKDIYNNYKKNHDLGIADKFLQACKKINDNSFGVKVFSEDHVKKILEKCRDLPVFVATKIKEAELDYNKNINIEDYKKKYDKDFIVKQVYGDKASFKDLQTLPKYLQIILDTYANFKLKYDPKFAKEVTDDYVHSDYFGRFTEYLYIDKIRENSNYIVNIAFNNNNWMSRIQENYNKCKEIASEIEKDAVNNVKNIEDSEKAALIQQYITSINNCVQILIRSSVLDNQFFQMLRINYLDCINKVIVEGRKAKYKSKS